MLWPCAKKWHHTVPRTTPFLSHKNALQLHEHRFIATRAARPAPTLPFSLPTMQSYCTALPLVIDDHHHLKAITVRIGETAHFDYACTSFSASQLYYYCTQMNSTSVHYMLLLYRNTTGSIVTSMRSVQYTITVQTRPKRRRGLTFAGRAPQAPRLTLHPHLDRLRACLDKLFTQKYSSHNRTTTGYSIYDPVAPGPTYRNIAATVLPRSFRGCLKGDRLNIVSVMWTMV